jgi:hypothetical protein
MNTKRVFVRVAVAAGLAAGITLASGTSAGAGEPANRARIGGQLLCPGDHPTVPGRVRGRGQRVRPDPSLPPPGLGEGIQALQAGVVPDDVVPNTCND